MNNFSNQSWNNNQQNNQNNQQQASSNQQSNQQQANNQADQPQPSWIMQIAGACLPVLMKQFTGQKMTSASSQPSTNAMEIQLVLSQVLTLQQQIITSQQELTRRVINLENRASQQFTGLFQQVKNLKGIRLTHDREHKQIELSGNGNFQHQQEN